MMWDECGRHEAEIPFERLRTSARVCARDVCNAFFDSFGSCTRDWHDNHSTHKAELPATFVSAQSYLVGLKRELEVVRFPGLFVDVSRCQYFSKP